MARWLRVLSVRCVLGGLGVARVLGSAPAAASSATELVREARQHEAAREDDVAARRYTEALALDPTCDEAYLGLGALRLRLGDAKEAERVFSTALSHVPDLRAAQVGRARARRAQGALSAADIDLEDVTRTDSDGTILRELATWYAAEGNTLAELSVWRRLRALAERHPGEPAILSEARLTVRALEILIGSLDPVAAPGRSAVRRGMSRMDRRR